MNKEGQMRYNYLLVKEVNLTMNGQECCWVKQCQTLVEAQETDKEWDAILKSSYPYGEFPSKIYSLNEVLPN